MKIVAFDTETEKFRPGLMAPRMACMTWQTATDEAPSIVHGNDPRAYVLLAGWIEDPEVQIVGQHVAFDLGVVAAKWPHLAPRIFAAYMNDRVHCTKLRMQLLDIATGAFKGGPDDRGVWRKPTYGLDMIARRLLGKRLVKDGWRKRYGEFIDTPLDGWIALAEQKRIEAQDLLDRGVKDKDLEAVVEQPAQQIIQYPLDDASSTLAVFLEQDKLAAAVDEELGATVFADSARRSRASWWQVLTSNWGMRTRASGVDELRKATEAHVRQLEIELVATGLVRKNGTRDTKAAAARMVEVCGAAGFAVRKTEGGGVSLDRDACKESGDPTLKAYGDLTQFKAVLTKDVPMLLAGVDLPIHTSFGLAETGRATSSNPNLQNMRRLPGIREAFMPRPGAVFAQADYPQLELRTLAQACLDLVGHSELARMLNAGRDPHLAFAAAMLGISYEEAYRRRKDKDVDDARQIGKVFNFGKPGGLGIDKLILFARKTYGVVLTREQVRAFGQTWLETLPEMRDYFDMAGRMTANPDQLATFEQLRSKRIRGAVTYTATCNSFFQGLGADATAAAGFVVSHACYCEPESPLFGSRIVNYIHDEFILETADNENAHDAAVELSRLMREAANEWVPDVPFKAPDPEPLLMRVWSKKAEAVHDARGRLVPWEPAVSQAA